MTNPEVDIKPGNGPVTRFAEIEWRAGGQPSQTSTAIWDGTHWWSIDALAEVGVRWCQIEANQVLAVRPMRLVPQDASGQPWVEIGGVRMTQRQFDAARYPLLHPDPTLAPAGPGADRTEPHPITGVSIPIKPDGSTDWPRFAGELLRSAGPTGSMTSEIGTAEPGGLDRVDDETRLQQVYLALNEPYRTPGDSPREPDWVMTWERALDILAERTAAWSTLLQRAEFADAQWLSQWRADLAAVEPEPSEATGAERPAERPIEEWRIGEFYRIHVYAGDRPVATFHQEQDAARAVAAVNAPGTGTSTEEATAAERRRIASFVHELLTGHVPADPDWDVSVRLLGERLLASEAIRYRTAIEIALGAVGALQRTLGSAVDLSHIEALLANSLRDGG